MGKTWCNKSRLTNSASFALAASSPMTRWSASIMYMYWFVGCGMNFRGVYIKGIESCLSFVPNFGIWKMLRKIKSQQAQSMKHESREGKLSRNNWYNIKFAFRHMPLASRSQYFITAISSNHNEKRKGCLPEYTSSYSDQAFRTKLGRKAECMIECFKNQGSEVQKTLMRVIEP